MERFELINFNLPEKGIIKLKYIKNPKTPLIAYGKSGEIKVGLLFFNEFNKKRQNAIIWHEIYHTLISTCFRVLWWEIKRLSEREVNYKKEFEADKYASKNYSQKHVLNFLKTIERLCNKGIVKYNPKTHPPIEERIKRVKDL